LLTPNTVSIYDVGDNSCNPGHPDIAVSIEKKRKEYAFRHQFNEKPSIIPGCPGAVSILTLGLHRMILRIGNRWVFVLTAAAAVAAAID